MWSKNCSRSENKEEIVFMENNLSLTKKNIKLEKHKKCFPSKKAFEISFWNKLKTTFTRGKPFECINCNEVFCTNCYKNEIKTKRKNPYKNGYSIAKFVMT